MSSHRVDISTTFSGVDCQKLPPTRLLENITIERELYLPNKSLIEAVNLAIALGRPLLLQGDPGCGKTRLAYAVAYELGLPLELSYIKSTSRAQDLLYSYDAINRLYDAQLGAEGPREADQVSPKARHIQNYITLGALGRAIVRAQYDKRRSVVLIDEIDKADLDFPNDLLWELDRLEFSVAEAPEMHHTVPSNRPELRPIIFVTHNEEKTLPVAFLRRCIFHYVHFPEDESHLQQILAIHEIDNPALTQKAVQILLKLRQLDLSKKPGLSELLDWVGYLKAVKAKPEDLESLPFPGVLLKQQVDLELARKEFPKK